jgi:SAM-dependent methyltransferase
MEKGEQKPGPLTRCQITGSKDLFEAIDLGFQPSAGALLTKEGLRGPETHYPLRLMISRSSGLGQLDYVVDPKLLFSTTEYVYRTGISEPLRVHLAALTDQITETLALPKRSLCIDVGSNDGTLLIGFRAQGMRVLGIEPTNMAKIARKENRIPTLQAFFGDATAKEVAKKHGRADIITFTNVFAHVADLHSVMRGLARLLKKDGAIVTESQYLLDVLERNQFDQIYHEHVRIYSLKSLVKLFSLYGMEVFDAYHVKTREGSIRIYAGWKGKHAIRPSVKRLLDAEEKAGLFSPSAWAKFRTQVETSKTRFLELALKAKREGKLLVADSCPTRGVVVMNYFGLASDLVPYIAQLPKTEKVGKYMAGTHNPIVSNEIILKDKPDYIVILAWHFADFIVKNWRAKGLKSKFIVPLPKFRIIE